jgi:hypothetical protein
VVVVTNAMPDGEEAGTRGHATNIVAWRQCPQDRPEEAANGQDDESNVPEWQISGV